jgi:acetolactate synthase-1/3 small subunit
MKHTLAVLVEDKPGVLTRIAGLFARRAFNIESLVVGQSEDPSLSRMTITFDGAAHPVDQVTKQLHKLINVVKIRELDPQAMIACELMLIKVASEGEKKTEVLQIGEIFKAKIVNVERRAVVLRVTGTSDKLDALIELLKPMGILEIVRTGTIAIGRAIGT